MSTVTKQSLSVSKPGRQAKAELLNEQKQEIREAVSNSGLSIYDHILTSTTSFHFSIWITMAILITMNLKLPYVL